MLDFMLEVGPGWTLGPSHPEKEVGSEFSAESSDSGQMRTHEAFIPEHTVDNG